MDKRLLDKEWRVEHLYKIKPKPKKNANKFARSGKIQFRKNRAQRHFNENRHTRNIILKSRQLGFSTYEAIDSLDDALFTPNFTATMVNYEKEQAISMFKDKISFAWDNLPDELKALYVVDAERANQFTFDFGRNSFSTIAVKRSGRGMTNNRVHVSELAKMCRKYPKEAEEMLDGTIPSVPEFGRIDIESTAEGADGLFYDMFWDAWNRPRDPQPTEFKAHFYNWQWDDDGLSEVKVPIPFSEMDQGKLFEEYAVKHKLSPIEITFYYKMWLASEKKWDTLRRNYPTTPEEAFTASGSKLFPQEVTDKLYRTLKQPLIAFGDWTIYEFALNDHFYCVGADVSEGGGSDSSTAVILDVTDEVARVVAVYESKTIPPDEFAYELVRGASRYGEPIIGVERNSIGHTTLNVLKSIWGNIFTEVKYDKIADTYTEKLGWYSSSLTKPKMMYELSGDLERQMIEISDKGLYHELKTYDKDEIRRTKFNPDQTRHWDKVTALAIAWQMKSFAFDTGLEVHKL